MKTELSSSVRYQDYLAQFDYDPSLPLDVHESDFEFREGIAIHDVSFAGVAPGRVEACLVAPPGEGKHPVVIFVHPGPGNRHTFLDEAIELARRGAVSLLIDAPWARGQAWGRTMGEPEHDLEEHRKTAKDLRRAIDLVSTRPGVNAERIAYVGHSLGALFGAVLAGVEKRIKTFVLMGGAGTFADVAVSSIPPLRGLALDRYRQVLMPIDPLCYIRLAAPAPLLFQFGFQDHTCARDRFIEFAAAGSEPKAVIWYNADHDLPDPAARRDRLDWLQMHLGLDKRSETQPAVREVSISPRRRYGGRE